MHLFPTLLTLHNINRWLLLIAGLYAIIRAIVGIAQSNYGKRDDASQSIFVGLCHLQLLLGLILYFISPIVNQAFEMGIGKAMKIVDLRFYAIEHTLVMFIAIVLIQIGRSLSKKQNTALGKHKKALIFFSIGLLLILSRIPWQKAFWPI